MYYTRGFDWNREQKNSNKIIGLDILGSFCFGLRRARHTSDYITVVFFSRRFTCFVSESFDRRRNLISPLVLCYPYHRCRRIDIFFSIPVLSRVFSNRRVFLSPHFVRPLTTIHRDRALDR